MKEYRDKLQKLAEQGKISSLEYFHMLVITYQLMDSEGKQKEYKKLQGGFKMTNLQYYFHKNYQAYLDLKNKLELQDLENEIFYENLENDFIEVEKQGYLDEYIDILEKENLV